MPNLRQVYNDLFGETLTSASLEMIAMERRDECGKIAEPDER
jgi:hypothetical protein